MRVPMIQCPICKVSTLVPVWRKVPEYSGNYPTGRNRVICDYLLCESCGYTETVDDSFDIK